jgi:hypothetical protein
MFQAMCATTDITIESAAIAISPYIIPHERPVDNQLDYIKYAVGFCALYEIE